MKAGQNLKVNRTKKLKVKGGQNLQDMGQSRDNDGATKKSPAKYVTPGSLGRRVPNRPTSFSSLMYLSTPHSARESPVVTSNMAQRAREVLVERKMQVPLEEPTVEDAQVEPAANMAADADMDANDDVHVAANDESANRGKFIVNLMT
ncbi:unnamed protein product [Linum trigynum]|uniref:Uncharacterized protein n=1 Tax=Linum trigynum TaxID=586398 RepID=A0AAV2DXX4_9ROSI